MHRVLKNRRDERGAVALLVAAFLTAMLVAVAMVMDFGLLRVDRQINKSAADSAVTAGLHGLSGAGTKARPFNGVCMALKYLQRNDQRFSNVLTGGTWTDASPSPVTKGNGCSAPLTTQACVPANPSTWARYTWSGTFQGEPVHVVVQSGYLLTSGSGSQWREESLPAVAADNNDNSGGCFQLAVTIKQSRDPGIGSLATSSDLRSSIRSVGRVKPMAGQDAPAMLLLRRTGCPVLGTGGSGGGSFIHVLGAVSPPPDNKTQPGTIHADASGAACSGGSNESIFWGRADDGIVAYAAPLVGDPTSPDLEKPGQISSYAVYLDVSNTSNVVRDSDKRVYGATGVSPSAPGTGNLTQARDLVTRSPVDDRYLGTTTSPSSGVRGIVQSAQNNVFNKSVATPADWTSAGYAATAPCNKQGKITTLPALNLAKALYVDCTADVLKEIPTLNGWESIVFSGSLDPTDTISAPDAKKLYVFGSPTTALNIQNDSSTFSMNTTARVNASGECLTTPLANEQAIMVVRDGNIAQSGGLLRLCNTTLLMMSGTTDACLPATPGEAPKPLPCAGTTGTGQIAKNGGVINWTAPNQHSLMTLADGSPDPTKAPAWTSLDGPEDLAFWSESSNSSGSVKFRMTGGGGALKVVGVYMIPNADFEIGGNAAQTLTNAQYIASSILLNGNGTNITMSVDPNSAVTIPRLGLVGLVR